MRRVLIACVAAPLLFAACGNDLGTTTPNDNTAAGTGLPCDIEAIVVDRCAGCHGTTPSGGAPLSLVTYADLTARNAAGVMAVQRGVDRMKTTTAQMPPAPAAAASTAEIATIEAWIAAGTPSGECAGSGAPGPFDGPAVCTSATLWTRGNHESPAMHPGVACIQCHSQGEGPRFNVAGTVYPTGHEPDDCNGAPAASVEVTDAAGKVSTLAVNAAGNFYSSTTIKFPIQVAVVANGARRAMSSSPPTGDCNTCHTQDGANQAPGRIALP